MMPNFSSTGAVFLFMLSCLNVSAQTEVTCQNAGTLAIASDDFIIFNLNPTAPSANYVSPYTYTLTATRAGSPVDVTLSDGSAATSVPYGILSPFRTASGTAGGGDITLTVTPNFGSPAVPVTYTLPDPGACAASATCSAGQGKTVTYRYRSPQSTTDAENWQAHIPKFNQTGTETQTLTLTGVAVSMKSTVLNSFILENNAVAKQGETGTKYKVLIGSTTSFSLDGSSLPLTNNIGTFVDKDFVLPDPILVPAGGMWGGDVMTSGVLSTLGRMKEDGWLRARAFTYLDPTTDPRWVTEATNNETNDDDMFISLGNSKTATNDASFSAPGDLLKFIGASGNIPLTYSTKSTQSFGAGGGNSNSANYTQTYFEVEVTYTYDEACKTVLPVKLESFKAEKADNGVRLAWKVAEETNFDRYEIEHSTNAKNFVKIGTVSGAQMKAYSFVHENPVAGLNYYRLKSVDLDATYSLSTIVNAKAEGARTQNIYPNPTRVSETLHIPSAASGKVASVEIVNLSGRVTHTFGKSDVESGLSISSLKSGLYLVRVYRTDGLVNVTRLVVTE